MSFANRSIVFAALLPLSCNAPPPTRVEADWSDAIARLDYTSIYPITEDLQPGDVLLSIPSTGPEPQPTVQRLGSIDKATITKWLANQEAYRMGMGRAAGEAKAKLAEGAPASTVTLVANSTGTITTQMTLSPSSPAAEAKPAKGAAPAKAAGARGGAAKAAPAKAAEDPPKPLPPEVLDSDATQALDKPLQPRLRRVAVPAVVAARVYSGSLGAGGLSGGLSFGGVFGGRGEALVMVSLKNLEALGLDTLDAYNLLEGQRRAWLQAHQLSAPKLLFIASQADPGLGDRLCQGKPPLSQRAVIDVVNRVLYARQIEFEYQRGSSFAGKLAVSLAQSAAAGAAVPKAGAPAAAPGAPAASAVGSGADAAVGQVNSQLASLVGSLALPSAPGVQSTLGIGSSGEVALTDTFEQPMAVGYNAVSSYSVRSSLIFIAASQDEADEQDRQLVSICPPADNPLAIVSGLQPIERLACENTAKLIPVMPELLLASQCLVAGTQARTGKEQADHLLPGIAAIHSEALTPMPSRPPVKG